MASPGSSSLDQPSSNQQYFCHKCTHNVDGVGEDMQCPVCHSGFLELLNETETSDFPDEDNSRTSPAGTATFTNHGNAPSMNANNFMQEFIPMLMQQLASQQQQQQSAAQPTTSQGTGAPGPVQNQPALGFLQHLMDGLTAGGGAFQIQFQMGGENESGQGGGAGGNPFFFNLAGNPGDYAWGPDSLDAIVTQLLNQVEGGAAPLNRDQIASLPKIDVTQEDVDNRQQCPVCFDDFALAERVVQLKCNHRFHVACIEPWMERHNSCPVCRKAAVEVPNSAQSGGGGSGNPLPTAANMAGGNGFRFHTQPPGSMFAPGSTPSQPPFSDGQSSGNNPPSSGRSTSNSAGNASQSNANSGGNGFRLTDIFGGMDSIIGNLFRMTDGGGTSGSGTSSGTQTGPSQTQSDTRTTSTATIGASGPGGGGEGRSRATGGRRLGGGGESQPQLDPLDEYD